jgi:lipopolysaccharide transport protein LptA
MACSLLKSGIAVLLVAAAGVSPAQTPDRSQLPIKLEAESTDFDTQNGLFIFNRVMIAQGDVRITAERAVASGLGFEDSRWEFTGKVQIKMPESGVASDLAKVRFGGGEVQSATVTGNPATFEQRREKDLTQGRADRIDYDLQRGTVEFAGDAWLSDGRNEVAGATLVYSTVNQRVISNKPVVITIQPGDPTPQIAPAPAPEPKPQP